MTPLRSWIAEMRSKAEKATSRDRYQMSTLILALSPETVRLMLDVCEDANSGDIDATERSVTRLREHVEKARQRRQTE